MSERAFVALEISTWPGTAVVESPGLFVSLLPVGRELGGRKLRRARGHSCGKFACRLTGGATVWKLA